MRSNCTFIGILTLAHIRMVNPCHHLRRLYPSTTHCFPNYHAPSPRTKYSSPSLLCRPMFHHVPLVHCSIVGYRFVIRQTKFGYPPNRCVWAMWKGSYVLGTAEVELSGRIG